MKRFSNFIVKNNILILIISLILMVPTLIGYVNTRVNYDILVYLPEHVDTIKGEHLLTNDFHLGSYAFVMIDMKDEYKVLNLEKKIRKIDGVHKVFSLIDVVGTGVPKEMLPDKVLDKLYSDDTSIIMVTFDDSTSSDKTVNAVRKLRKEVGDASKVSSMTSLVLDTMDLSNSEMLIYVFISVLLCIIVLLFSTNSYVVPIFLLLNIGMAIFYNLGTNIMFGEICYLTKAITAILQLGVTTDFSIFLYHKYEQAKKKSNDKKEAMSSAICDTFQSVIGSSLTTFVGFLALCTMDLTLGTDIGLVMSKGVLFGLVCVLTIFPSLLLTFDSLIEKTKHKNFLPSFKRIQKFSIKYSLPIFIAFLVLLVPAIYGNNHYQVYYKLDDALPSDLPFHVSNSELASKFGITSPEIIILRRDLSSSKVRELTDKLEKVDGIDFVISFNTLMNDGMVSLLPDDLKEIVDHPKYQLILLNSKYEVASDELNNQVLKIEKMVKKYDKNGIVAGEGALMKDLVTIADHDLKMVNYTSVGVIFIVMVFVLKSLGLPLLLIFTIEFAIFLNMAFSYFTGVKLPFVASIVVGTIQLGATIDYAILMASTYLEKRHSYEVKKAMEETLKLCVPSIITSALCFFAATVGVSIYTRIDMIGSICHLLSRGAIISMLVVIIILPSLLMMFDKFILKTTIFKKEGK